MASTAANRGDTELNGTARDAPTMEMAVKFSVRASGWCSVARRRYQGMALRGTSPKASRWNTKASVPAITSPVLAESSAAAGAGTRWVAMRTSIWLKPNPRAALKAKTMPISKKLSPIL